MRRRRNYRRRRIIGSFRHKKYPAYKIAIEILLIIAMVEGTFFILKNYKKIKPGAAKVEVARPGIVKPEAIRPKMEVVRVEAPKPKVEGPKVKVEAVKPPPKAKPEAEVKPQTQPEEKPGPKIKPKRQPLRPAKKPRLPAGSQGKIAIVLDDWGYSLNNMRIVDQLNYPFTAAVLPNLRYSGEAAEELHKRGLEVILHLPLEPQAKFRMEKDTLLTSMNEEQIKDIVERDLDNLVYARGISNHMGSKATEDPRLMEELFKEFKKRHLYFLDSSVTAQSVGPDLAKRMGISFIERDVFLDNNSDPEYIKKQIDKLKTIAQKNGFAVGIGHDRRATLEVLKEVMPELEEEGYKFIFVSELIK